MKNPIREQLAVALITVLFFAKPGTVLAQGFYISAGGGYGLSAAPNLFLASEESSNISYIYTGSVNVTSGSGTSKNIKGSGSFGKGFQSGATVGYMFSKHIGAELGISYLSGRSITSKYSSSSEFLYAGNSSLNTYYSYSGEESSSARMLRFSPGIRISMGNGIVTPYMRGGVVIGKGKMESSSSVTIRQDGFTEDAEMQTVFSGGTSIGFTCGLGVDFKLGKRMGFFSEFGLITQSWAPRRAIITKFESNGMDVLPFLTTSEKETEFLNSVSYNWPENIASSPREELKIFVPLSSVGVNMGFRFKFGSTE